MSTASSTDTLKRLRSELLTLTDSERASLAYELIKSLDGTAEAGVEAAWDREIINRIAQMDTGQARLLNRDELQQKVKDKTGS